MDFSMPTCDSSFRVAFKIGSIKRTSKSDWSGSVMYGLIFDKTESSTFDTSDILASFPLAFERSFVVRLIDLFK